MSLYIPIFNEHVQSTFYEFEQLLDRDGKLIISMVDNNRRVMNVCFDSYFVYRKMDEGDSLATLSEIQKAQNPTGVFYRVENSEFLAWFNKESFDIRAQQALSHYAIVTMNDIVDVISLDPPAFELTDK